MSFGSGTGRLVRSGMIPWLGAGSMGIVVTDPHGDSVGATFNTILDGSSYDSTSDFNGDLQRDERVDIPNPIAGTYQVLVVAKEGVPDSAQFTTSIRINGNQLLETGYHDASVSSLAGDGSDTASTVIYDADLDGVDDTTDNCYGIANPNQTASDADSLGDA